MNNHNQQNIRSGMSVLGIAALLVGVATASILYWSFGVTLAERGVYALVGVIFATAGGLLLPAAVALWQSERPGAAAGVFVFWLAAILPLGLSGHAGFFSLAQSELAAQSIPAQAERARLELIEGQLSTATVSGDATALRAQADILRDELTAAQAELSACPPNYITKCLKPAGEKISRIRAEMSPLVAALSSHDRIATLENQRVQTLDALATASRGGMSGGTHPLFDTLAKLFGVSPPEMQAIFLAWSAAALELVAALAFIIAGALSDRASATVPPAVVSRPHLEPAPALDTGGRIHSDGLAHLHSGEAVLNAQAVEALEQIEPGLIDRLNSIIGHVPTGTRGHDQDMAGHDATAGHVPYGTRAKPMSDAGGQGADTLDMADTSGTPPGTPPGRVASAMAHECKEKKIAEALMAASSIPEYAAMLAEMKTDNAANKRRKGRIIIKAMLGNGEGCETATLDRILREVL